jgi:type IV fimbrial biogenesis protein FimT
LGVRELDKSIGALVRRGAKSRTGGWSLLELMMVLLLLSVLLTLGGTSWTPLRQKYQLQAQAEDLRSTLALARSEAVKRGVRVTACVSSDGLYCQNTGNWTQGWLLFEDTNANALRSDAEPLIEVHGALPSGVLAYGNSPVARYVSYAPNSRSYSVNDAPQLGTITVCRSSKESRSGWQLAINFVGNARLDPATLASCG